MRVCEVCCKNEADFVCEGCSRDLCVEHVVSGIGTNDAIGCARCASDGTLVKEDAEPCMCGDCIDARREKQRMTRQEVFDKAAQHLLTQNARSATPDMCLYRDPNGLKCAVGFFIPDELYSPAMEGKGFLALLEAYPDLVTLWDGPTQGLLKALQGIHDGYEPGEWLSELRELAVRFRLSPAVLEQFEKARGAQ